MSRHASATVYGLLLVLMLLVLSYALPVAAQTNLLFTHHGKDEGLNQSSVNCMLQDRQGMLWVGTFGGINRFDGYSFRSFANDFDDPHSVADNSIWAALEDSRGQLWFGTKAGLSRYDADTQHFENHAIADATGMVSVKALLETRDGELIVGSEGAGAFRFDRDTGAFTALAASLGRAKVVALAQDSAGRLWLGTEERGLFSISPGSNDAVSHLSTPPMLAAKSIGALLADGQGGLWVGSDLGLAERVAADDAFRLRGSGDDALATKIKTLARDHEGALWVGSATAGLLRLPATGTPERWSSAPNDPAKPHDSDVSSIVVGENGVLFVGYYMKGFDTAIETPFRVFSHDPKYSQSVAHDVVYSMHASQDLLWLGTFGGGLDRWDPKTGAVTHHRHDADDPESLSHDWVRYIYEAPSGQWWVGTWGGGLNRFDPTTGTFRRYLSDPIAPDTSLSMNIVTAVFEDWDKQLWVGTYGGGLNRYRPESDDFEHVRHDPANDQTLSDDHITAIYQWQPQVLWITTYGGGINRYDKSSGIFERYLVDRRDPHSLNSLKVLHMYPEQDDFWVTTLGGGLNRFSPATKRFRHWTVNDGLADNTTMGILRSPDGHLWMGTNTGLSRFDPKSEAFTNYTTVDGIPSDDFNLEAYAQTSDGTMYFGGKRGVVHFHPTAVVPSATFPTLAVTTVRVDDEQRQLERDAMLSVPYRARVAFEFAALNPQKPGRVQYRYRLAGYSDSWIALGRRRIVEFAALAPGNYELQLQSTNSSGVWNTATLSAAFVIPAPWYMTWTFRLLSIAAIMLAAIAFYVARVRRLEAQQRVLERTVVARTATISQQNQELEGALDEVTRLERFKESLTSMVVHDLKNPLASVLGASQKPPSATTHKRIHASGVTMLQLVENMLDVQRFEKAEMPVSQTQVSLRAVVATAVEGVRMAATERRIEVHNEISPSLTVLADVPLLERILANLLGNAVKFSPLGAAVTLAAEVLDELVEVRVSDSGPGVAEHLQDELFEPFSQVDARDFGGTRSTGIGLWFCRLAVESHGGHIGVRSLPGAGSTFHFTLPMGVPDAAPDHAVPKSTGGSAPSALVLSAEDCALLLRKFPKLSELSIYESSDWYAIAEVAEAADSAPLSIWAQRLRNALAQFDEEGLTALKQRADGEAHDDDRSD